MTLTLSENSIHPEYESFCHPNLRIENISAS
jgi:hypothetical protein